MSKELRKRLALEYHAKGRPGKIEVISTKEAKTQHDLSLAYSPGVAEPCKAIRQNAEAVYKYTAKGNLVAVISNGTSVLGLGDIGPEAGKPVMEGKAVLFKVFADIDVFDIEIDEKDPEKFVQIVRSLEPTFGGINLEDIKAPECFYIEAALRSSMKIPVMHDDQHGTAIISSAALLNALALQGKSLDAVKIVINGAGAAAMACVQLYEALGAKSGHIIMFDKEGVLYKGRPGLDEIKKRFANATNKNLTLAEAMKGADVFVGLSAAKTVTPAMVKSMGKRPVVFALANPDPEISWDEANAVRKDIIMATGRTDYPNQVNNVLGFPYIFRGALDVRATGINEEMKMAAVKALADLAKTPVPDIVTLAYGERNMVFGPRYIIPKPLDPRLISTVSPAVAKAAIESGVARHVIEDWEKYKIELDGRLGNDNQLFRVIGTKARKDPRRVVFAEADNERILKAAQIVLDENIAYPILLGEEQRIAAIARENGIDLEGMVVINPRSDTWSKIRDEYAALYFKKRQRRGVNYYEASKSMKDRIRFACMMVSAGDADAVIGGLTRNYPDTVKPALEIVGTESGVDKIAGMYIVVTKKGPLFLADTTVNFNPTAEELANITLLTAKEIKIFGITPHIALLSYSNFGTSDGAEAKLVRKTRELLKQMSPDLIVDGEMQGIIAFNKEILKENFPFSELVDKDVNTLIFPNLSAGNIAYNLLQEMAGFDTIGPVLLGLDKPVHVLQLGSSVRTIVNMVQIAVVDAQQKSPRNNNGRSGKDHPWWGKS
ncbi:MAG: NADP-dependent malic enzyme [Chitinophagaceae bacterium]|nr:NADP-dependent malic enzyme [Chitinophagaceae bacterium]